MKIGIIGAGEIAKLHSQALQSMGVPIAAITDVNRAGYERNQSVFGSARFYASVDDLLRDPEIDIAAICVNTGAHLDIIRRAAAAGKHLFCEKTLTDSGDNSQHVVQMLHDYAKNFQVGYMKRFFPATKKMVELLPEIGQPFSAYIRSYQGFDRTSDMYEDKGWQPQDGKPSYIRTRVGAGMLNMAGSHMLDLMNLLLGAPKNVYALNWKPPAFDVETNAHAMLRMTSGCIVQFEAALSPYSRGGALRDGWDESIEINGTRGKLEIFYTIWDKPGQNAPRLRFYSESTRAHTEFTFPKVDPFKEEWSYFLANCAEGRKSVPGAPEGHFVDRIIQACYSSADSGQIVPL